MQIRHNILFFPDKSSKPNIGYLRMRVRWCDNSVTFNLGYTIEIDKWVKVAQRVKANSTHGKKKVLAVIINKEIERQSQIIEDCFYRFEKDNIIPSKEQITDLYLEKIGKKKEHNIEDDFECFIDNVSQDKSWTATTKRRYKVVFHKFCEITRVKTAKSINENVIKDFVKYLIANDYKNTYIEKNLECIHHFLTWAEKNKLVDSVCEFDIKLKTVQKTIVYLTWEELQRVYTSDFEQAHLNKARDLFCFCCFTGLRYSDMSKVTKANIYDNAIHIITKKTNTSITIELNKYSLAILKKYDYVLPTMSNVKLNKHLKTIGKIAELNEDIKLVYYVGGDRKEIFEKKYNLLSTHCGRRTFVCNSLALGISPQVIMKWTGHTDINSMKPYMEIADTFRKQEMTKFDKI